MSSRYDYILLTVCDICLIGLSGSRSKTCFIKYIKTQYRKLFNDNVNWTETNKIIVDFTNTYNLFFKKNSSRIDTNVCLVNQM